jgi:PST family polysaccharide transporter
MSLTKTTVHAFKWSVLGEISSKVVGPLVFLILARILVPEDFGVVAAATVVISFSQVFWDAGLSKALIQRQEDVEAAATIAFWINMGLGVLIALLLIVTAPRLASFFHDDRITLVLQVLALQLPLAAISSVHNALLQKDFYFRKLFWIRLITSTAPALASVPLALWGTGYWALVAGTLTGQIAQTIVLWRASPWRPSLQFDKAVAIELWLFGRWAMLSALLGWFYVWMDAIIVGHYLGTHDMGLYRTGNTFVTMVFGLFFAPLLPVLYSAFSRAQKDLAKIREALLFIVKGIALIALPIAFGIHVLRVPIAGLIFGAQWDGVASVIGFMALMHGFSWIVGANGEVYRAIGKPYLEAWTSLAMLVVYLGGYLIAVQHGLEVFLVTRLCLALAAIPLHIGLACYFIGTDVRSWLGASMSAFVGAAGMWIIIGLSFDIFESTVTKLTFLMFIGALVYGSIVILTEYRYLKRLVPMISGRIAA